MLKYIQAEKGNDRLYTALLTGQELFVQQNCPALLLLFRSGQVPCF